MLKVIMLIQYKLKDPALRSVRILKAKNGSIGPVLIWYVSLKLMSYKKKIACQF